MDAKKCRYCGSYQSWLGRLSLGATFLTALTALVSVVALAAPVIRDAFTPDGASFEFGEPTIGPGEILLEAKNEGKAPASLDYAVLYIPQKSAGQPYIFILSGKGAATENRVEPGETKRLTFTFDRKTYDAPPVSVHDHGCSLEIFDQVRPLSCDEVRYLASAPSTSNTSRQGELPEEGPEPLVFEPEWRRIPD